jgi:hypothetical protein
MEPNLNVPRPNPEQLPPVVLPSPESLGVNPETRIEQMPAQVEQAPLQPAPVAPATPALPQPVVQPAVADDTVQLTGVPDVAADDDRIENQWVNKAKQIISETADDPRRREQAIGQLQREYLKKRYGKELGVSE